MAGAAMLMEHGESFKCHLSYCVQELRRSFVLRFLLIKSSAVRSWLAKNRFQRMRRAADVIKHGWRKWKVSMLVQESIEIGRLRLCGVGERIHLCQVTVQTQCCPFSKNCSTCSAEDGCKSCAAASMGWQCRDCRINSFLTFIKWENVPNGDVGGFL